MCDIIHKDLVEKTNTSINNILDIPVEKLSFDSKIPVNSDITDSNKVYKGKVSVLFADMRNSTKFTDDNSAKTVVKVYRSFLKTITRAVRVCNGNIRDFIGDGVLAVFLDKEIDGVVISSSEQAVMAGKMICTLIDYCLNPKLKEKYNIVVGYGIGISTGTVLATKVGMRGNESNPKLENETGIIWIGACTNYASKYCDVATSGEIVIDKSTYEKQVNKKDWIATQKIKGDSVFDCFISKKNYLEIETDDSPASLETNQITNSVGTTINNLLVERLENYEAKIKELTSLEEKLNKKQKELIEKESTLNKKEHGQKFFEEKLNERKKLLDEKHYNDMSNIIKHAHCKHAYAKECGENFWDEQLELTIEAGKEMGKTKLDVEIELCYALADIYGNLDSWEKAYNYLCIQAEHYSWIHASTVKNYIVKSNHWVRIKNIIDNRIKSDVPYNLGESLRECQKEIKKMGYN